MGQSSVPIQVQGLSRPLMVTDGYCFSIALMPDHTLIAWGNNLDGELGDGTTNDRYGPAPITGIDDVIWLSAGWTHVVAIKADGTVWTWGANVWNGAFDTCNNGVFCGYGKLGDDTTLDHHKPQQVPGLSGACADGSIWSWGSGQNGELGNATMQNSAVPVRVNPF